MTHYSTWFTSPWLIWFRMDCSALIDRSPPVTGLLGIGSVIPGNPGIEIPPMPFPLPGPNKDCCPTGASPKSDWPLLPLIEGREPVAVLSAFSRGWGTILEPGTGPRSDWPLLPPGKQHVYNVEIFCFLQSCIICEHFSKVDILINKWEEKEKYP